VNSKSSSHNHIIGSTPDPDLLPVVWAALEQSTASACITTAQLDHPGPEIVYVNPAFQAMTGYDRDEAVGQSPRFMQGPLTERSELDRLRSNLQSGDPFIGETVNYRRDGAPFLIRWRIDPIVSTSGEITHFIATQSDITHHRRNETLLTAIRTIDNQVSRIIQNPGSASENFSSLALEIQNAVGAMIPYGRPAVEAMIRIGNNTIMFPDRFTPLEAPRNQLPPQQENPGAQWSSKHETHTISYRFVSPVEGLNGVIAAEAITPYERAFVDNDGLEFLASHSRRALANLAEYERQRHAALELQHRLLPRAVPPVPGFTLEAQYRPGAFGTQLGGDWYDVIDENSASQDRTICIIGDLAGSGLAAAAEMGRLQVLTRELFRQNMPVPKLLSLLNEFCVDDDIVATIQVAILNRQTQHLEIHSAGHLPPVLIRDDHADLASITPGPMLGVAGNPTYPATTVPFHQFDGLVLYTDGLVETPDTELDVSLDTLANSIAAFDDESSDLAHWLIEQRQSGPPLHDDIAVLTAYHLPQAERTL